MAGKSRSAKYYNSNPEAKRKKDAYNTVFNRKKEQRKKRSELTTRNRAADKRGTDRTGKDWDHGSKKYISSSTNRGKTSGTAGDKRARGKKKK